MTKDIDFTDEETYRQMSVPFESVDELNVAAEAFQIELYELRKKYCVRELLFVMQSGVKRIDTDGKTYEDSPILCGYFGDLMRAEVLSAYALGNIQTRRQEMIAETIDRAGRTVKAASKRK